MHFPLDLALSKKLTILYLQGINQAPVDLPIGPQSTGPNRNRLMPNDKINILFAQNPQINVNVTDQNRTVQVDFTDGGIVVWDETGEEDIYYLANYHLHAPSEHSVDGKRYDAELHLQHKSYTTGRILSVGIFFDRKAGGNMKSEFFESLNLNQLKGNVSKIRVPYVPMMELLNKVDISGPGKLWMYYGSRTSPPCEEIATWFVTHDPQPISDEQVDMLNARWKNNPNFAGRNGNYRNANPLYFRYIYYKVPTDMLGIMSASTYLINT